MSEQTSAQRMAEIATRYRFGGGRVLRSDFDWLFDRCRKLEKVAEAARDCYLFERDMPDDVDRGDALEILTDALKGAGDGD